MARKRRKKQQLRIDALDLKIIAELRHDGRQTNTALAKKLGVTEGTIRSRVNNLQENEVIKIIAVSSLDKIGYSVTSMIGIQVQMANLRSVAEELSKKPNVFHLAFIAGRYDLLAMVVSRTPKDLSSFIENEISVIPGVLRTETFLNLDIIKGQRPGSLDIVELIKAAKLSDVKLEQ